VLQGFASVSTLLFILVGAIVGIRLVLLSRKTGGLPEFVFGGGLAVIVGLGYPLILTGRGAVHDAPDQARWLMALAAIPMSIGWTAVWVFTWRVFRPDSSLARWTCFGAMGAMALFASLTIYRCMTVVDPASLDFGELAFTGTAFVAMASYLWGCVESARYYGMMKKRLKLGLADPVVTNRILLWTLVMVFSLISTGIPTAASTLGVNSIESAPVMLAAALAGLLCSASLWLAFIPPAAYLKRVQAA